MIKEKIALYSSQQRFSLARFSKPTRRSVSGSTRAEKVDTGRIFVSFLKCYSKNCSVSQKSTVIFCTLVLMWNTSGMVFDHGYFDIVLG